MLAVVLAAAAFAQETTIKVPQGSGVLPTIGQVNCLEEMGSRRLCAATYECSGESGRLWGDLANHDGRRAINQDSPVARGRDCTITVDGRAAVRWLTAYSPHGRDGELVGLTTSADALRPVQRVQPPAGTGEGGTRLLAYLLERHDVTFADLVDERCGHIQQDHFDHHLCTVPLLRNALRLADFELNEFTRCQDEGLEQWCQDPDTKADNHRMFTCKMGSGDHYGLLENRRYLHIFDICLPLAEEMLAGYGLELYLDDSGNREVRLRD